MFDCEETRSLRLGGEVLSRHDLLALVRIMCELPSDIFWIEHVTK